MFILLKPYKVPTSVLVIAVAIFYFLMGRLGQYVALPPGFVTPIWPPSGIALAAVLIFGFRAIPGIFIGSFVHNLLLYDHSASNHLDYLESVLVAIGIGFGATLQAIVAALMIMQWLPKDHIFHKAENVFKFLIIVMASALVNSNIGLLVLYLAGKVSIVDYFYYWWTWWLGDTGGMIVFTPLILSFLRFPILSAKKIAEGVLLLAITGIVMYWIFINDYPLTYMLIPVLVWAAFRFRLFGATTLICLLSIVFCLATAKNMGPFVSTTLNISLIFLSSFSLVVAMMSLLLVAALAERDAAEQKLERYSLALEEKIEERTIEMDRRMKQVQQMQKQIITQEKLASLGTLTAGIAHEIKNPLNFIINFAELNLKALTKIISCMETPGITREEERLSIVKYVDTLNLNLKKMTEYGKKANNIVDNMLLHARGRPGSMQSVDINALVDEYVALAYHGFNLQDRSFTVSVEKDYDATIGKIQLLPQDISRALLNILNNALYSLRLKKKKEKENYFPVLRVVTKDLGDRIVISIFDNGVGIAPDVRMRLFIPFFTTKPAGEGTGLGLSIANEIVVLGHGGEIQVNTKEGEYAEFKLILPKEPIG